MATTKIWAVKSRLDHVLQYAENEEKTINAEWSKVDYQSMRDVMDYAMNDAKTEQQYYVSGWNCDPDTAREEMQMTKQQYGKEGGILAFHGYQSFKPGEVTPEEAHEIGMKLAQELWPDHQVIVATHLDKAHIHSHFVVNSVSLYGRKFNACKASYRQMREASDRLCREYGLSVITQPKKEPRPHYTEWAAEHAGEQTWRSIIREDMDAVIRQSMTMQQFYSGMRSKGYTFEQRGKNLRIKAKGMHRFVRLHSLGDGYTEWAIQRKILAHRYPSVEKKQKPEKHYVRVKGDFRLSKVTWNSLRALYFFYLRKLRAAKANPKQPYPFVLKEDMQKLDTISEQSKFLNRYKLDTAEQVTELKETLTQKLSELQAERTALNNERRRVNTTEVRKSEIEERLKELSKTGTQLRRDAKLCDAVLERSVVIAEKNRILREEAQVQRPAEKGRNGTRSGGRMYGR
ncbi:MAG: relaxase/mobilization nuclease domain-containing protein [Clostridia bacterium]|nr:relaxase/mobilization nuclease domain-containing protein [Clostridia bacterium]